MIAATCFSALFLVSYITDHFFHRDGIFPGHGWVRTAYLAVLASHVLLSVVALPLIFATSAQTNLHAVLNRCEGEKAFGSTVFRGSLCAPDDRKIEVEFFMLMRAQLISRAIDPNRTLVRV